MELESMPSTTSSTEPAASAQEPASSSHLPYVYAQKLNNNAALCIGCGQYQRAESSLTKALHLSKKYILEQKNKNAKVCRCYHCTLDGCIVFTEDSHRAMGVRGTMDSNLSERDIENLQRVSSSSSSSSSFHQESSVFQRPIRVPFLPVAEGHNMGNVLSLIIVFNLGMALHLRAIQEDHGGTEKRILLEKALRLYEVAYKFLEQYQSIGENKGEGNNNNNIKGTPNETELQFKVLLCNNLYHAQLRLNSIQSNGSTGDLDSSTRSTQKNKYLQELLSTLLCVVQRKFFRTSTETDSNNNHFLEQYAQRRFINLEGFWKTVDHLVLKSQCADAA